MLTEDGKHLYVSYDEYHNLIEKLAIKVHQSGWEFDTILCLARGGLRPGDILSRIFDKPLAIMSTSSYRADAGTVQGHLDIARYITTPKGEIAGRVLLVDDLADSGHTLHAVLDLLRNYYAPVTDLIHHPYVPPRGFAAPQPGIFKASTVIFPNVAALRARNWKSKDGYTYGLHGTPTTFLLEERIATLEGGTQ